MPVGMPNINLGFSGIWFSKFMFALKIILWLVIILGIIFVIIWYITYKNRIIILGKRIRFDKAKRIIRKDGSIDFRFFKNMTLKRGRHTIPPPNEDLAYSFEKNKGTYFYNQSGDFEYHLIKVPNDFSSKELDNVIKDINKDLKAGEYVLKKYPKLFGLIKRKREIIYTPLKLPKEIKGVDKLEVVPVNYYNWYVNRDQRSMRRLQKTQQWKEWILPMAFAVFVVMVCITLIYLFKELPRSISVNVVQAGKQAIPGFT